MEIKNILFLKVFFISLFLLLSACEKEEPKVSAADHIDLARLYLEQGAFKASIIEGKNALQLEPNSIEALTTMATVLLKLNAADTASNLIKKAIAIDKENQDIKLILTKTYLLQSKLFSARNIFNGINEASIKNISNYQTTHGDLLFASNKINDAKTWYLKAHASDKSNIDAILGIAKSSLQLKQLDDLNTYTMLAVETAPTDINALLWQARVSMLQKQYVKAESILSKVMIELERYDILTLNKYFAIDMLSKALVAQGKIEESLIYSNYLAQSKPGQIQKSFENALNLISKEGNLNEAEKAFQEVLQQSPTHKSSNIMLGVINYQKGDYTQAEDYLSKFASGENSPLRSKKILALTKIKLNKPDEAIKFITNTINVNKEDADLYALLGYAYLVKRELPKSISALKNAIRLSKDNALYYTHLAKSYLVNKQTSLALEMAKKAISINPNSEPAKQILIGSYISNKEPNKAKKITSAWLKQSPKNITALSISAAIAQQERNFKKATTQYLKVLAISPYNLLANMNLVKLDLMKNNQNKAFERLDLIVNKYPENTAALSILFKLSSTPETTKKAIEIINSANSKHPFAISTRLVLAQLYLRKNWPDKALIVIDDVTKLDNKNIKAYFLKAKVLLSLKQISKAKDTYKLLVSLAPKNPSSHIELGRLAIQAKQYDSAIEYANTALKLRNNFIPSHLIFYTVGIETNNKAMVIKAIKSIKDISPNSPLHYELEADLHLKNKDYKAAIDKLLLAWSKKQTSQLANKFKSTYLLNDQKDLAFDAWDELSKQNKSNVKLQILYAFNLQKANKFKKAKIILESQLKHYPKNVILLNNLANLYLDTNNRKALKTAKKALAIHPDSPAIQDTVGWIYVKQNKNYKKGIELLKKAYDTSLDEEIKEHLITAFTLSGRTKEADALKNQ